MEHGERSDWECVQRVCGGETEAFAILVRRHEKAIFNLLYRWLGSYDEAADVGQEVFLSAFRFLRRFRGESSFSTWLYRIAVNQAKNRRKVLMRSQKQMDPLDADPPDPVCDGDPAAKAEKREIQDAVQNALRRLDADDALVILLHDLQGVSYEEMARVLEIPMGTVKSRLHRARQALKAVLGPFYFSLESQK